jgi:hypothetical protein
VRSSTGIYDNSSTATDACSPRLAVKTVFGGNNRAANGRSACLGDSRHDTSAEYSISCGITNAGDCGIEEFPVYPSGLGKFTQSYRPGASDCGIGYTELTGYSSGFGKFTNF